MLAWLHLYYRDTRIIFIEVKKLIDIVDKKEWKKIKAKRLWLDFLLLGG